MEKSERIRIIKKRLTELGLDDEDAKTMANVLVNYPFMKVVKALRMLQVEHYRKKKKFTAKDVEKIVKKIRF